MRVAPSLVFVLRICGGLIFGLLGWYVADLFPVSLLPSPLNSTILLHIVTAIVAAVLAIVLVPALLAQHVNRFIDLVSHASGVQIIAGFIGFTTGLLIAALLAFPLALLPDTELVEAFCDSHDRTMTHREVQPLPEPASPPLK